MWLNYEPLFPKHPLKELDYAGYNYSKKERIEKWTSETALFVNPYYNPSYDSDCWSMESSSRSGSPVNFVVTEPSKKIVKEEAKKSGAVTDSGPGNMPMAHGDGLKRGVVRKPCSFTMEAQNLKGDIRLEILGPNGSKKPSSQIKPNVNKVKEGVFSISYVPLEAGEHKIKISWNNIEIPGSPFLPVIDEHEVGPDIPLPAIISDPSRVYIRKDGQDSNGRLQLNIRERVTIPINASEAGPGHLRAEVRGPKGKLLTSLDQVRPGHHELVFTPETEGEYFIYLYLNDKPVPDTPMPAIALSPELESAVLPAVAMTTAVKASDQSYDSHSESTLEDAETSMVMAAAVPLATLPVDPRKVFVTGSGIKEAKTNQLAEFTINGSEAGSGKPSCTMHGQRADIPVSLTSLGNNVWKATYTPFMPGKYELMVAWSDEPVSGSPFRVQVEALGEANKVVVAGDGVKQGILGRELKSTIDTRKAGPGTLQAECIGPSGRRVICELYTNKDKTYSLNIKPEETGKHTLAIKFGGEHVPGSPYALHVSSPPDPGKVSVYGPGVEHGILSKFDSTFTVETKGAGTGQLSVRIRGPKGAFNVEMSRESKQDRTIHCRYDPREPGDYHVEVRWAGEHVPGSPFTVMIFDTQNELERHMAGESADIYMSRPPYGFPPGWIGPPPPGFGGPPQRMLPPPGLIPGGPPMPPMPLALPPPPNMPPMGPPPPRGPMMFPPRGPFPYANSTIHSNISSKQPWLAQADF